MATTNRILLAKGPNGSNLDQLFEVKNNTSVPHTLILNSDYDLSSNLFSGIYYLNAQADVAATTAQTIWVPVPKKGTIQKIYAVNSADPGAASTLTFTNGNGGGASVTPTLAIPNGTAAGTVTTIVPTANADVDPNTAGENCIKIEIDNTAASPYKLTLTFEIKY